MTNLKRIIDEKGVQQSWLAEQVGVTKVSMSRYISGERIPKAPIAIRIADVLGVDVKELYGWEPETHEERTETHACDCISRQATIDAILAVTGNSSVRELYEHVQENGLSDMWSGGVNAAIDIIIAVPPVQPDSKELSFTRNALDTISRQDAIDALDCINGVEEVLRALPSAQPERETAKFIRWMECKKTAKYISYTPHCKCSKCGTEFLIATIKYCYMCGARMEDES